MDDGRIGEIPGNWERAMGRREGADRLVEIAMLDLRCRRVAACPLSLHPLSTASFTLTDGRHTSHRGYLSEAEARFELVVYCHEYSPKYPQTTLISNESIVEEDNSVYILTCGTSSTDV